MGANALLLVLKEYKLCLTDISRADSSWLLNAANGFKS